MKKEDKYYSEDNYMMDEPEELSERELEIAKKLLGRKRSVRAIAFLMGAFCLLMSSLMAYVCYYATTHRQEMFNNSYNAHQAQVAKQTVRGTVYARDGRVLAETVPGQDGTEERRYPYGRVFAHAVGYATKGKSGVELLANYYLANSTCSISEKVGYEYAGEKYPGDSIYTTFDADVQQAAFDALGMYKGAVIATEPSTGKILAMVSKPDYEPSEIAQNWEELVEDKSSSVLLNRATQGLYPPGSTFKIVTALQYIREHPDDYGEYTYLCNGSFTLDGNTINCYHKTVHNRVDFTTSFAKSCNSSFANMGASLDRDSFNGTLRQLLFNTDLPVDFPYKKSSVTMDGSVETGDVMQVAIGQGTDALTPLHLNMITCAIANNGILMKPYMTDRVVNHDGQIIKQFMPSEYGSIMTQQETAVLKDLMQEVVESGTGKKLSGLSFTAAGKTGSAEYNNVKGDSHAWFTGFAPVEDPQICVTVIIEGAGTGGDYAVPLAKRIMQEYLGD